LFIFGEFTTVLQLFCKVKEISISIPRRLLMIWVNKTRDNSMTSQGTCVVSESIFSELSENSNCLDPTGIIFLSKLLNASRQGEFTQIYPNPDLKWKTSHNLWLDYQIKKGYGIIICACWSALKWWYGEDSMVHLTGKINLWQEFWWLRMMTIYGK